MYRASSESGTNLRKASTQRPPPDAPEFLDLDRRMADDEQRLVAPDVIFERRDIEIADKNGAPGGDLVRRANPATISSRKGQFVGEFCR